MNTAAEQLLLRRAHNAGVDAGIAAIPTPMIVQQHASPLNDNSPVVQSWRVDEGVCGFAWIVLKPATSRLARVAKETLGAGPNYEFGAKSGISIWVGDFGQSMTRKEAYARAYAQVLRDAGYDAYARSRMD